MIQEETHPAILALYKRFEKSEKGFEATSFDKVVILQFTLEQLEESHNDYNEVTIDDDWKMPCWELKKELRKELVFRKLQLDV